MGTRSPRDPLIELAIGQAPPGDQQVLCKHADGLDDLVYPRSRIVDQRPIEVLENPVAVVASLGRQLDAGQHYFASVRPEERFAALPATRPSR